MSGPGKLTIVAPSSGGALTPAEVRLLSAFRLMDNDRRGGLQRIANGYVQAYPRRDAPSLVLISGGKS
jgi:hypothetical protein